MFYKEEDLALIHVNFEVILTDLLPSCIEAYLSMHLMAKGEPSSMYKAFRTSAKEPLNRIFFTLLKSIGRYKTNECSLSR